MAFKEPTRRDLEQTLSLSRLILALAFIFPVLALTIPYPRVAGLELTGWFSRSGSVTTIFAILAEVILIRAKLSITPPGFGWTGLNELRAEFIPKFERPEMLILILTVVGTLIWAYGDLLLTWLTTH